MSRRKVADPAAELAAMDEAVAHERQVAIMGPVLYQADLSRRDLLTFFNFVAREETTKRPIQALPHQEVLFEFVQAHPQCVIFMPPGAAKTYSLAIITLWLLGNNQTERGAIISDTETQASKPLGMVRDYIETSDDLHFVYPLLYPSIRRGDPWTQTRITVQRPPGIRDPSLVAVGVDGALPGSRLSWIIIDDVLSLDNTRTQDQRDKVSDYVITTGLSRVDIGPGTNGRVVISNTAHHPNDVQHRLIKTGMPALKIGVSGNVYLYNTDWDTDLIRPSVHGPKKPEGPYRLVKNDKKHPKGFDEHDELSIWPEKFTKPEIAKLKKRFTPRRYKQVYEQISSDEASQKCKEEWIEKCKYPGLKFLDGPYKDGNYTTTGVDLAVQEGEENDFTAFVTLEFRPDGLMRILHVEFGQWDGPTIVDKIIRISAKYKSVIRVENNAAQDYILQFTRKAKKSCRVVPHTTGRTKSHPEFGIEGIFIDFSNGAFMLPCDMDRQFDEVMQYLIDGCLEYTPAKHTNDVLMALWFAVEQGRKVAAFKAAAQGGGRAEMMSR